MNENGPHVLILGGLGMIGRNVVKYIRDYNLASYIRVVDKSIPMMAHLGSMFEPSFAEADWFEVIQGDLSVESTVDKAFAPPQSTGFPFTIVINLAAETQYGFMEQKYERAVYSLRVLCAQKAAATGAVDKYIEVSTAQVYDCSNGKLEKESSTKLKPWTMIAKQHLRAEEALKSLAKSLNYIVVRLPVVYGAGDVRGLMPRIVCGAVYQFANIRMDFLWGEDLRLHTVHVQDVAAALWHIICAGEIHEIYNVVDENDTSQSKFNKVLEVVYPKLKTGFHGTIMSNLAKMQLEELMENANDEHMEHWEALLAKSDIVDTPVNPYLEKELLYNTPCSIDGSKLKALGFECSCPNVTPELVLEAIAYWRDQKLFPAY
jgi:nucleoside-diphosphate-sugar epimerase